VKLSTRPHSLMAPKSAFAGFRFPAEVIVVAVRWYLRYNLSYQDVEELLVERGVEADHVTVFRWVQRFTPLLADGARFARHSPAIGGSSTKRTSRSTGYGGTSTGPSTSTGRSSTCSSRLDVMALRPGGSSNGRCGR
jgi:hypothetical protein